MTTPPRARTRKRLALAAAVFGLGLAAFLVARQLAPGVELVRVPMRALAVPEDLPRVDAIPAAPGALAGRDVLLITLDTTRPDRLGAYGNRGIETPNFDRLAREGVIFSNAVAVAPTTLPTHASILTGLYPLRHGARANSSFVLGPEQTTLAERLRRAGYATGAFVSAFVLDRRFGVYQGFEVYDDELPSAGDAISVAERSADRTTDRAVRWLERPHERPRFTWVHYYDAHAYWTPPSPFAELYPIAYDGEIAFVDSQIGRLLEAADADTVVVVVGDHGEALGEHGEGTHGILVQDATLRIPLVVRAPGGLPSGVHVPTRVSQIDLVPSLLSLLGEPVPKGLDGRSFLQPPDPERAIYAENLEPRLQYGWARLAALYRGPFKYVDGPSPELYELARDPLESDDLAAGSADRVESLRREMRAIQAVADDTLRPRNELEPEELRRLRVLGYVVAADRRVQAGGPGWDPTRWLPLYERLQVLLSVSRTPLPEWARWWGRLSGRPMPFGGAELTEVYEQIAERNPDFAPVYSYLIDLYRAGGRSEDATRAERRMSEAIRTASSGLPAP